MDDRHLTRMARSLQAWQRALGNSAAGGSVFEVGELVASVVPAARSRSLVNAAAAPHPAVFGAGDLDAVATRYREAGGEVWGVWVHESNRAARRVLEDAGYALDSSPAAMAIELESLLADAGPAPQLEVARTDDLKVVAQPLSAGYGFPSEFLTRGLPGLLEHCEAWVAWVDRAPAAGLLLVGEGDDVGVFMVATAPEQRGRGAAALALSTALASCRERGFETSTLQASAMGRSVYARMGYRELGAYELWEWRPART